MQYHFNTRCIHSTDSFIEGHPYGSVSTPVCLTSTFVHPGVDQSTGYDYTRESNPTRAELEKQVASLENAFDAIATSSGMAAIVLAFGLFERGDHIICTEDLYGGSVRFFESLERKAGLKFSYINTSDADAVEKAITPSTKALYIETPSNPTMQVTDLRRMHDLAEAHHLLLIVDNTFLSPYFQNPIDLGADIVIHSGTKYLSGHNDVLSGFVCAKDPEIAAKLRFDYKTTGSCLSPMDSYLMLRGIKTLAVRMDRQQENAQKIARWLKEQKKVRDVYYVGLPDHPGYEVNRSQARGSGAMISFRLENADEAVRTLSSIRLIGYAESLGGVESLLTYPMKQTHGDVPVEVREKLGITEDFLRLSVGIEQAEDLIADLDQAING